MILVTAFARRGRPAQPVDMNFLSLIEAKRDGGRHSPAEIAWIIGELVGGRLPDYQVAAWLMAVFFRGLEREELATLTLAMRDSGERLEFPEDSRPLVDKHSTGGVGDKVSLPLAPLLASLGFRVPMISGRALGITGGTLDKLESIPGFTTQLTRDQIVGQVQEIGVAMAGQTERMVPADRILYALRDVTGTVPNLSLITASILSKKLAESLDALVLDVKFGRAAFMKTRAEAQRLAETMEQLAGDCGVPTRAILSDMNRPLGSAVGNWLEVKESVACLSGGGPPDLRELVLDCAAHLTEMTGRAPNLAAARSLAAEHLDSGAALAKWEQLLEAQGARLEEYRAMILQDTLAAATAEVTAQAAGNLRDVDGALIGAVLRDHGAGRVCRGAVIRAEIGLDRICPVSSTVARGSLLARVHANSPSEASGMAAKLQSAFVVS
jgi:pyrimidine-nucleoside phosphorylase